MVGPDDGQGGPAREIDGLDVLASSTPRTPRPWVIGAAILALVAVVGVLLYGGGGSGEDAAAPTPGTTITTSASPSALPSTPQVPRPPLTSNPIEPADITEGVLPDVLGLPIGTTALTAARAVADGYCARIASWVIRLEPIDDYDHVIALLRPSGPAYPGVALQIDLTWDGSRYSWRASRSALESCP